MRRNTLIRFLFMIHKMFVFVYEHLEPLPFPESCLLPCIFGIAQFLNKSFLSLYRNNRMSGCPCVQKDLGNC